MILSTQTSLLGAPISVVLEISTLSWNLAKMNQNVSKHRGLSWRLATPDNSRSGAICKDMVLMCYNRTTATVSIGALALCSLYALFTLSLSLFICHSIIIWEYQNVLASLAAPLPSKSVPVCKNMNLRAHQNLVIALPQVALAIPWNLSMWPKWQSP